MLKDASKTYWSWAAVLGAGSIVLGFVLTYLPNPPVAKGANIVPFVARRTTQYFGRSPGMLSSMDSTFARRSDSSWAHSYDVQYDAQLQDGSRRRVFEYVDVSSLTAVHSEPVTQSIMTLHLTATDLPLNVEAGFKACDGSETAPGPEHSTMLDFEVVKLSVTEQGDTEVKWVAPALDCFPIQSTFTTHDGRRVNTIVNSIEVGQPPAELFLPPMGYVERSPKQTRSVYQMVFPGVKYLPDSMLELVESRYQKAQRK